MSDASMKIAVMLTAIDKFTSVIGPALDNAKGKLQSFQDRANKIAEKSFQTGKQLVASGLAVGAPLYGAIKSAQEFQDKMIDIRKQMQNDTPEAVQKMTEQVFQLGKELPIATDKIEDMIASGLRMGIAEDKIIDYTRNVAKMSVAFDMLPDEIAESMGKISNVFKIPIEKIGDFADAINYLDDNTMAKGADLIDVLQRIGGTAKYLKPQEAAAFASTMLSLGESSEQAGTGINAFMTVLSAASVRSKKTQEAFRQLGLEPGEVQKRMVKDAQGTIIDVLNKINSLPAAAQTSMISNLFGNEHIGKIQKLANNVEEYRKQLSLVNGQEKNSMSKEWQKRAESSSAKFQEMKNRMTEMAVKIGTILLPIFDKLISIVGKITDKFSKFSDNHPSLIKNIGMLAAGFTGIALVGGYLAFVIGGVAKTFSIFAAVIEGVVATVNFLRGAFKLLNYINAGPLILTITAIALAAFLIIKNWSKIKAFVAGIVDWIKGKWQSFLNWCRSFFPNIWNNFKNACSTLWNWVTGWASNIWNAITSPFTTAWNWITNKAKDFYNAGKNIVKSIRDGIADFFMWPVRKISDMVTKIRSYLPFSPAKNGALRDIHRIRLVQTIAESIKPDSLINKMKAVTQQTFDVVSGGAPKGFTPSFASGRGNIISPTFHIHLTGGATREDANRVSKETKKQFSQMMKQYNNQKDRVRF